MLCVTALADSVRQAQRAAYAAIADIRFAGMQFRTDIGYRALVAAQVTAMDIVEFGRGRTWFLDLQERIVAGLEAVAGEPFRRDEWTRPEGGGGLSRLIENGRVFERGGVLFSHVTGDRMPASATAHRPELAGRSWEAMGVSLVLHPRNPYAPTVHLNVRFFVAQKAEAEPVWWFGGGMDLTPYYGFAEDAVHFHRTCRDALAPFGADVHARYKKWCDDYFFLKHRQEPRGIGGIFYDDLNDGGFERCFALTRASAITSSPPMRRSSSGARTRRTASASAISSCIAAAATSSSTSCGTAARCSDCSRTVAPRRS